MIKKLFKWFTDLFKQKPLPDPPPVLIVRHAVLNDAKSMAHLDHLVRHQQENLGDIDYFINLISTKRGHAFVCTYLDDFLGYIAFHTQKTHTELISVVIHPEWQRMGVGTQLVWAVQHCAEPYGRPLVLSMIREKELDAQLFLKACGFKCSDTQEDFFEDPPDNGLLFEFYR